MARAKSHHDEQAGMAAAPPPPEGDPSYGDPNAHGAAEPTPAEPAEPTQMDKDEKLPAVNPAEAEALLRAGHRLRKRGDDPKTQWVAMTRHRGDLVICIPATEGNIADFLEKSSDLVVSDPEAA